MNNPGSSMQLITVLAGYAPSGSLSKVAFRWIQALREISTYLVLVFDQDNLDDLEKLFADDHSVEVICERHGAYDFGSYKRGLRLAAKRDWIKRVHHVLLCNDSVIGPFTDLYSILKEMVVDTTSVWGLTDSHIYRPHLQSYFLLIQRSVIERDEVRTFFGNVTPQPCRHDVIQCYELGFSNLMTSLGLKWRAWLPINSMFDPKTGEQMTNSTAYPVCSLAAGSPVVKQRALKELSANADGLWATCQVICLAHPQLWKELWGETQYRRLWQESIPLTVLLGPSDINILEERLQWIKAHPHPKLSTIVAICANQIVIRADIVRRCRSYLEEGTMSMLIVGSTVYSRRTILEMLAATKTDWIVASSSSLWSDFSGLQIQLRKLISNPSQRKVFGRPQLWRREECFDPENLKLLTDEMELFEV